MYVSRIQRSEFFLCLNFVSIVNSSCVHIMSSKSLSTMALIFVFLCHWPFACESLYIQQVNLRLYHFLNQVLNFLGFENVIISRKIIFSYVKKKLTHKLMCVAWVDRKLYLSWNHLPTLGTTPHRVWSGYNRSVTELALHHF